MFVILSLQHKVYSNRNNFTGLMDGVMEVVDYNAYDLKYISSEDISYLKNHLCQADKAFPRCLEE